MLNKLILLVILLILAKPAYDITMGFLADTPIPVEVATEPVPSVESIEGDVLPAQATSPPVAQPPKTATSVAQLTDAFAYYFDQFTTQFTISYKGSTAQLEQLLNEATEAAIARNPYVGGHLDTREIEYEYTKQAATISVTQSYLTTPAQEQRVDAIVTQILQSQPIATMSDYEKVKFVNDYIVKNTEYSEQASASPHSAYAVAYEGRGVCQGYALFAQKLLTAMGIESLYVVGEVYTGGHAWNLVKVDGEWYHLDTTWNDPLPDRGHSVRYEYFLKNDADMKQDHTWESKNYPRAASKKFVSWHQMQDIYEYNGDRYFANSKDDYTIYRQQQNTNSIDRVADVRAMYLVGVGDWLYFSNYSQGAYLSRMKVDGSSLEVLVREEVEQLYIEEGYLYFTTDEGLKKMAL